MEKNRKLKQEIKTLEEEKKYIKNQLYYIYRTTSNSSSNLDILRRVKYKLEEVKLKKDLNRVRQEIANKQDKIEKLELRRKNRKK